MSFLDIREVANLRMILQEVESDQNIKRKSEDFRAHKIMAGAQRDYVKSELKSKFPDSHHVMTPSNINILKKVNDRLSKTYNNPPTRLVNGSKNENLDKIYKQGLFDRSYMSMDKTYNRSRCVLNWVQNVVEMPTEFRLIALAQYTFDVIIDNDTLELLMVILSYPDNTITNMDGTLASNSNNEIIAETDVDSSANSKQYAIWTKDFHVNITTKSLNKTTTIDYMIDDDNPDMLNKLGVVPFVWTSTEPEVPEYPTINPLPEESVSINVMNSTLLTAATKQIGILVLKYPEGSRINQIYRGFTVALQLPQKKDLDPNIPTTAEYLVPNSDLTGMRETFLEYTSGVLSDNGLEGATMSGENTNFSSGLERLIATASITEKRAENIQTYKHVENQVFNIIKKYDDVNGTRLFSKDDSLTVVFDEPKAIVSEADRLAIIEKKESLGLLEEKDKFEIAFPGMTEKDIKKKIKRIEKEKLKKVEAFIGSDDSFSTNSNEEVLGGDNKEELSE